MWQWQGSNDYVLTSTSLNLNFQQIINMLFALFKDEFHFFPNVVLNILFSGLHVVFLNYHLEELENQGKEVRDQFLYILPLFSIQT